MTWQVAVTDVDDPERHRAVATQVRENFATIHGTLRGWWKP